MLNKTLRSRFGLLIVCAGLYLLIDLPFRATGSPVFAGCVGPKNFLPVSMGVLFGPFGTIGTCLGTAVAGLVALAPFENILFECICAIIMGGGSWLLWYCGSGARVVMLKRWCDLGRLMACVISLSALCTAISLAFWDGGVTTVSIFLSLSIWNALLSVPVIIFTTSILGILQICPAWCPNNADMDHDFPAETQSIQSINDKLDELCLNKRFDQRKCFQVQNCIEELLLRILSNKAWSGLHLRVYIHDSVCLYLEYSGSQYNPLNIGKEESHEELIGLLLIKWRALRASYHYRNGVNELHIVL